MAEVTIKIPGEIKDIIGEIDEPIYIEAIKTIAQKKLVQKQKKLKGFQRKIAVFESKYGKSYGDFAKNVPDTIRCHDDWIEWTYLQKTADELASNIEKLKLLLGK